MPERAHGHPCGAAGGPVLSGLLPGPTEAAAFATAVLLLNATPGVDFLLTVSRTLQAGPRSGAAAALGIALGCMAHALGAAFGLAALLALHPAAFVAIQWLGAGYLGWLGFGMLRQAWRPQAGATLATGRVPPRSLVAEVRAGLMTNLLNPKVALFFLAFLPQFVPAGTPHRTLSFLLLGAWFVAQGLAFLLALVALSARVARAAVPGAAAAPLARMLGALGGLLFLGLALRLIRERPVLS